MRASSLVPLGLLCASVASIATAGEADGLDHALAAAFSAAPISGLRLSPDGEHLSQIQMHPSGVTVARVVDLTTGAVTPVIAGSREWSEPMDVAWCGWASSRRLICGLRPLGIKTAHAESVQLVGVDRDGGNRETLWGLRTGDQPTRPYGIVHWLPAHPDRVLVAVANPNGSGFGVAYLDVHDGDIIEEIQGPERILRWIPDGHGEPRLYQRFTRVEELWFARDTPGSPWTLLHKKELTDTEDAFAPVGFGDGRNELLYFDKHEGRRALFALDLANNRSRRLIYAHERLDVADVQSLGKEQRFAAAAYFDDRLELKFLDERAGTLHAQLQSTFVGKTVSFVDEDWNRRYYLIRVDGADDPGIYYRFDSERNALLELFPVYPGLAGREMAPVRAVTYRADDGSRVPAYLTLPNGEAEEPPPAVVLLHDGPSSRDYLRFDFLAQYLAAKGHAVLQINFRGSAGYGYEWAGQGGYRDWRRAISDISDGTGFLVLEDLVDHRRICIGGWGYGGYAALMSVIEDVGLYRCVFSIAGVTDTRSHGAVDLQYVGGAATRSFIGTSGDVLKAGSPIKRAKEIRAPTLLFHGKRDADVRAQQSAALARALRRARHDPVLVEYEYAEHDIRSEHDRTDMLTRLGSFLGEHLAK